jgi:hypothetical protein
MNIFLVATIGYIPFLYQLYQYVLCYEIVYCSGVILPDYEVSLDIKHRIQVKHTISYCDGIYYDTIYASSVNDELVTKYFKTKDKKFYTWSSIWSDSNIQENKMIFYTLLSFILVLCTTIIQIIIIEDKHIKRMKIKKS